MHHLNKYEMGDPIKEPDRIFKKFISFSEKKTNYRHLPVAFAHPPNRPGTPDSGH